MLNAIFFYCPVFLFVYFILFFFLFCFFLLLASRSCKQFLYMISGKMRIFLISEDLSLSVSLQCFFIRCYFMATKCTLSLSLYIYIYKERESERERERERIFRLQFFLQPSFINDKRKLLLFFLSY